MDNELSNLMRMLKVMGGGGAGAGPGANLSALREEDKTMRLWYRLSRFKLFNL